jgi:hypothetical protein
MAKRELLYTPLLGQYLRFISLATLANTLTASSRLARLTKTALERYMNSGHSH